MEIITFGAALFVSIALFVIHRICEWKFERERFLRGKIEEVSLKIHTLVQLIDIPSPSEDHKNISLSFHRSCTSKIRTIFAEITNLKIIVSLYFPELNKMIEKLSEEVEIFIEIIAKCAREQSCLDGAVTDVMLDQAETIGKKSRELYKYIADNHLELTGNIMGR